MIRSVLFLEPLGGDVRAIEQFFVSEGVLEHASATPGFVAAELQLPEDRTAPAMVTALWASPKPTGAGSTTPGGPRTPSAAAPFSGPSSSQVAGGRCTR